MLKKLIIKAICAAFVLGGLSLYAGYLTTGQLPPVIARLRHFSAPGSGSPDALGWSNIGALSKQSTDNNGNYQVLQGGRTTIYKWQDAKGVWQYGEHAPLNGVKSTKIEVVAASSAPAAKSVSEEKAAAAPGSVVKDAAPVLVNPYSADGVKQIMEKAREAQQKMNEHTRQQEQM